MEEEIIQLTKLLKQYIETIKTLDLQGTKWTFATHNNNVMQCLHDWQLLNKNRKTKWPAHFSERVSVCQQF